MTNSQKQTAQGIWQMIQKSKSILIPLHLGPDGDMVASALALAYVLKKLGKKYQITSAEKIPENLLFLFGAVKIKKVDASFEGFSRFDLIAYLDQADFNRFTKNEGFKIPSDLSSLNIDHHATNAHFAKLNLVNTKVCSTGEILFELFKFWQIKIDQTLASLLYFGLLTDTGFFEFVESPSPHLIAAELLKLGATHSDFVFQIKRQNSIATLKYWGRVLEKAKVDKKFRFCYSTLSHEELEEIGGDPTDYQAAVQFLKTVKDTDFGLILSEEERGEVYGSLRARKQSDQKGSFDVSKVAKFFGGGGHAAAAGFRLKMDFAKAEKYVFSEIKKYLKAR